MRYYPPAMKSTKIWQVIAASSVGTMIEWYDFYIFGSLATVISPLFYPPGNDTLAYFAYLSTFAVGFIVRPFGALFFGRIGDLVGRKYAFLITLLIMGGATAVIGILPTYASIGLLAPVALLVIPYSAGSCTRRRVWRSGGLRCRARARREARVLHQLHSDHRDIGLVRVAGGDPRRSECDDERGVRHMGLARAFSYLDLSRWNFSLYPVRMKESPIFQHIKTAGMTSAKPLKEASRTGTISNGF
jgi:hypothetical protein